jgi:hypothetical protein
MRWMMVMVMMKIDIGASKIQAVSIARAPMRVPFRSLLNTRFRGFMVSMYRQSLIEKHVAEVFDFV